VVALRAESAFNMSDSIKTFEITKIGVVLIATTLTISGGLAVTGPRLAASQSRIGFVVNSTSDLSDAAPGDGLCSTPVATCTLRAAVEESNALPGADTITLPAGIYIITSKLLFTDDVDLTGEDRETTVISAAGVDVALSVSDEVTEADPDVTIQSVTVERSTSVGIDIHSGNLTLVDANIRQSDGHGVRCEGHLDRPLINAMYSEISNNGMDGIFMKACVAVIVQSTISHNLGRGIYGAELGPPNHVTLLSTRIEGNLSGGLSGTGTAAFTLDSSTIANNTAAHGGGFYSSDGCAVLFATNSTFSGNRATGNGGGLYLPDTKCGPSRLSNTTITENIADDDNDGGGDGGGIFLGSSTVNGLFIKGSIVANNEDRSGQSPDCGGAQPLTSGGFNLIGDSTGCLITGDTLSNFTDMDPLLGPLSNNGGDTLTHRPAIQSPAIDVIPPGDCTTVVDDPVDFDQRGTERPEGTSCDIGSVELGFFYDGFETGDTSAWTSTD